MDLIRNIKIYLIDCKKDDELKDLPHNILIKIFFKRNELNIPPNIQKLICDDHLYFESIIKLYENKFIKYISDGRSIIESLEKLSHRIIVNPDIDNKKKYINFDETIFPWLKEFNFFNEIFEKNTIVTEKDVLDYIDQKEDIKKFIPRENQIEAFKHLEKYGLQTGIHCQATGTGKTFIILKYIGYTIKMKVPKIILFTERVNILADLFDFKKNSSLANQQNILKWKAWGLCDLTNYDIINRVTLKERDWVELLNNAVKPTLLVINRAYLTLHKKYKELNKDLTLVLHDECHNTSSNQCHEFLLDCKNNNVPIIGFSATPVRAGKNDLDKLRDIYGKKDGKTLNLLTNYNMIYSISKDLILPPEFHWYQFDTFKEKKNKGELVTQEELGAVLEVLNHIIPIMPNKKIIAWCGTIKLVKKWKELFEQAYRLIKNLAGFTFGLDTSQDKNNDYEEFKMSDGKSMLFCASKHREGSDIRLLDSCIFLDKVKDRGAIPFIQSIGRVLRKCPITTRKTKGIIIDGIVKDGNDYEKQFINKIFDYYLALENMSNITDDAKTKYDRFIEMKEIVIFNKEKETISMRLGSRIININCNKIDWNNIVGKFDSILQEKIRLSCDDNFRCKAQILKENFGFHMNTDFVKEYRKISSSDKKEYNFPDIDSDDYIKIFSNKSWFDFLEIEHDFYSDMREAKNNIKKNGFKLIDSKKNWKSWCKIDNKLPLYPVYVWDEFKWDYFEEIKPNNMFI